MRITASNTAVLNQRARRVPLPESARPGVVRPRLPLDASSMFQVAPATTRFLNPLESRQFYCQYLVDPQFDYAR